MAIGGGDETGCQIRQTTNKARISKYGSGAETDKYSAERDKSGAELDETAVPKKVPKLVATVKKQFLYYHLYPVFEGIYLILTLISSWCFSMLLLGSFESQPVPQSDIIKAQQIAVELSERNIPCRFVSHQVTHITQEYAKYKCGVEKISA